MKQFKGIRKYADIVATVKKLGYPLDVSDFDKGGDTITFGTPIVGEGKVDFGHTVLNVATGCFCVYSGKEGNGLVATERSEGLEGKPWYDEILSTVYAQ